MLNINTSDSIWQKSALRPYFSVSLDPRRPEIYGLLMTKDTLHDSTVHIDHRPVSEMCIIPTFLVTRPIHISKAGL